MMGKLATSKDNGKRNQVTFQPPIYESRIQMSPERNNRRRGDNRSAVRDSVADLFKMD